MLTAVISQKPAWSLQPPFYSFLHLVIKVNCLIIFWLTNFAFFRILLFALVHFGFLF